MTAADGKKLNSTNTNRQQPHGSVTAFALSIIEIIKCRQFGSYTYVRSAEENLPVQLARLPSTAERILEETDAKNTSVPHKQTQFQGC